jgi:hypothetical protein
MGKGIGVFHVERIECLRPELDDYEGERDQGASGSWISLFLPACAVFGLFAPQFCADDAPGR